MKTIKIQSGRGAWNHQPSAGMGWLHRRIWERISGPFFSFGLHALALVVILFCIPISRFGPEDDAIEVVMLENNPVELELDEPVLDQEMMTEEDFSDMDWVLPSPDAPPPPEIMDFNDPFAIDVADSPLILSSHVGGSITFRRAAGAGGRQPVRVR